MRDARDPTRPTLMSPVFQHSQSPSNLAKHFAIKQGSLNAKPCRKPDPKAKNMAAGEPKGCLGEPGVPQERLTEAASHPEPMELVSAPPFLRFCSQNGPQNGGPFFRKFAEQVVLRWLKTVPLAKNLEKRGFRKGSRFGTSFGTSFGWNLSSKS